MPIEPIQYDQTRDLTFAVEAFDRAHQDTTTNVKYAYNWICHLRLGMVLISAPPTQVANIVTRGLIMPMSTKLTNLTGYTQFETIGYAASEGMKFMASPAQYAVTCVANDLIKQLGNGLKSYVNRDVTVTLPLNLSFTIPQAEIEDFITIACDEVGNQALRQFEKNETIKSLYNEIDAEILGQKAVAPTPEPEKKNNSMNESTPQVKENLTNEIMEKLREQAELVKEQEALDAQFDNQEESNDTGCPYIPNNNLTKGLHILDKLDFPSPPGKAIFYSGPENRKLAEQYAKQIGGTTLEMLPAGQCLEKNDLFQDPKYHSYGTQLWQNASEKFASQASGDVYVFSYGRDPKDLFWSIFRNVELPALYCNENVQNIIICYSNPDGTIAQAPPFPVRSFNLFYGD